MNDKPVARRSNKEARCATDWGERIAEWRKDLDRAERQVMWLHHSRSIYTRLSRIAEANPRIQVDDDLYRWMQRNYLVDAAMCIRRLLDRNTRNDPISLTRIVQCIKKNSYLVTREWFVSQYQFVGTARYPVATDQPAHETFDRLVGAGRDNVDSDVLQSRLGRAQELSTRVLGYVDKSVAHTDNNPFPSRPDDIRSAADMEEDPTDRLMTFASEHLVVFEDFDEAIAAVTELFLYLHELLNQSSYLIVEPEGSFPWEKLFRDLWMGPDSGTAG